MSQGWRDVVLRDFAPEVAATVRLTVVADPDFLLAEQRILDALRCNGFEVVPFQDHLRFRYEYETHYRQRWDAGELPGTSVVLRSGTRDANEVPFDLLARARRHGRLLHYSLAELFPNLAASVLAEVDSGDLDALYEAQQRLRPERQSENGTLDFLLANVFGTPPATVNSPAALLRILIHRHYAARRYPPRADARFTEILKQRPCFADWPLEEIVADREAFFAFLGERWVRFARRHAGLDHEEPGTVGDEQGWRFRGGADLPFEEPQVRVLLDNLFTEGLVPRAAGIPADHLDAPWVRVGLLSPERDTPSRFDHLTDRIEETLPPEGARHQEWTEFARRWGEWIALRCDLSPTEADSRQARCTALCGAVDTRFATWMLASYASLSNVSFAAAPVMVHHVPRYLAQRRRSEGAEDRRRLALLVLDGLAVSQWTALRESMDAGAPKLAVHEQFVFAWVPTLTDVSRQAIFAGEPPFRFAPSLGGTGKEETLWKTLWREFGERPDAVFYVRQTDREREDLFIGRVREAAEHPKCKILGIVIGTIDGMMHGGVGGMTGFHRAVRDWGRDGYFRNLVSTLLDKGFDVYATSDHGNVEAIGVGRPNVGDLPERRGERAYLCAEESLRLHILEQHPRSIAWPVSAGLPDGCLPLLAGGRAAFCPSGARTVTHGGISVEEVIVPFLRFDAIR